MHARQKFWICICELSMKWNHVGNYPYNRVCHCSNWWTISIQTGWQVVDSASGCAGILIISEALKKISCWFQHISKFSRWIWPKGCINIPLNPPTREPPTPQPLNHPPGPGVGCGPCCGSWCGDIYGVRPGRGLSWWPNWVCRWSWGALTLEWDSMAGETWNLSHFVSLSSAFLWCFPPFSLGNKTTMKYW